MPQFYSEAANEAGRNLSAFTAAYIECIYFTSTGPDDEMDPSVEMSKEAVDLAVSDCAEFQKLAKAYLDEAYENHTYDEAQAGHDFWYTRNGHGVGYWDRGLDNLGEVLSNIARSFGTCDAYAGDDGLLYLA